MSEYYSLGLAVFNFVPNFAFLTGAFFLVRITILLSNRPSTTMALVGAVLIGTGGFLKAAWKLLFVLNIADIRWMSEIQFVLMAFGFLFLLIAVGRLVRLRPAPATAFPAFFMAGWKIPFLAVMTIASMGMQGILMLMAFRRGTPLAAAGFLVALLGLIAMGALAGGEQTLERQWLEEIINAFSQIGFAAGAWFLYKKIQQNSYG